MAKKSRNNSDGFDFSRDGVNFFNDSPNFISSNSYSVNPWVTGSSFDISNSNLGGDLISDYTIGGRGGGGGGRGLYSIPSDSGDNWDPRSYLEKLAKISALLEGVKKEEEKLSSQFTMIKEKQDALEKMKEDFSQRETLFNEKMDSQEEKMENLEQYMSETSIRSLEVVGVISSVIALVLVFADAATHLEDLRAIFIVLTLGTAGLAFFVSLVHLVVSYRKNNLIYWILGGALFLFLLAGIFIFSFYEAPQQTSFFGQATTIVPQPILTLEGSLGL